MKKNKWMEDLPLDSMDSPGGSDFNRGQQSGASSNSAVDAEVREVDAEKYGVLHGSKDHSFDGIQELDNPMPRWWVNLFIITVIFSICYLAWYHLPFFPSRYVEQVYQEQLQGGKNSDSAANKSGFDFAAAAKEANVVAEGKQLFAVNCASCHGELGQGTVGPNLTDDYWIHGNTGADLVKVISKGVGEKGMPAWENILGASKINKVVTFIFSIQGTNPAGAKEKQGSAGRLQ